GMSWSPLGRQAPARGKAKPARFTGDGVAGPDVAVCVAAGATVVGVAVTPLAVSEGALEALHAAATPNNASPDITTALSRASSRLAGTDPRIGAVAGAGKRARLGRPQLRREAASLAAACARSSTASSRGSRPPSPYFRARASDSKWSANAGFLGRSGPCR